MKTVCLSCVCARAFGSFHVGALQPSESLLFPLLRLGLIVLDIASNINVPQLRRFFFESFNDTNRLRVLL